MYAPEKVTKTPATTYVTAHEVRGRGVRAANETEDLVPGDVRKQK